MPLGGRDTIHRASGIGDVRPESSCPERESMRSRALLSRCGISFVWAHVLETEQRIRSAADASQHLQGLSPKPAWQMEPCSFVARLRRWHRWAAVACADFGYVHQPTHPPARSLCTARLGTTDWSRPTRGRERIPVMSDSKSIRLVGSLTPFWPHTHRP